MVFHKDARDNIQPFVPSSACDARPARQDFVAAKDLLDDDVEAGLLLLLHPPLYAPEILMRVAQPVDTVEPQPLQTTFGDQTKDKRVDRPENLGVFDLQPGQGIDVEE